MKHDEATQHRDKAAEENDQRAATAKDIFRDGHAALGEPDMFAVALQHPGPEETPDPVRGNAAHRRPGGAGEDDIPDLQPVRGRGIDRRRNQRRLTGSGSPRILQRDHPRHRKIPIPLQQPI